MAVPATQLTPLEHVAPAEHLAPVDLVAPTRCPAAADDCAPARSGQRKRGAELEDAIRAAVLAEIAEHGSSGFSVEGVAARAQTGKASIYRRWPTRADLLLDAFCVVGANRCMPDFTIPDDVTTEQAFRLVAARIAEVLGGGVGALMREVASEAARDPELAAAVQERVHAQGLRQVLGLLERGVRRGEVRPAAATERIAEVLPALMLYRVVWQDRPVTAAELTAIVDEVVLPLIRA